MDVQVLLRDLGFTDYEARAYIGLVGADTRNGYEVAKAAKLPRANVYPVLERLTERGAARRFDTANGVRYAAVKPARLIRRLDKRHKRTLAAAEKALGELETAEEAAPVFNLKGYDELIAQARAVVDAAEHELLVGIQPAEAVLLAGPLREARERGVAITTLCMEACDSECGGCQGEIHRYNVGPDGRSRWLLLVGDGDAIAGEIAVGGVRAVSTRQRLVKELTAAYIRQSLALSILADDMGADFKGLLSRPARKVLQTLRPNGDLLARLMDIAGRKSR